MEFLTREKTFVFACGELCILNDDQIERIPYLSAMVSAASGLSSIRNEQGQYILDPRIEPPHFAFVLESLSFHSIRQMFTHLSTRIDAVAIIALLDFLGLAPQDDPTFGDINLTFFFTMVFKPSTSRYLQKIAEFEMQDMAVRFGIALAQEHYDGTCEEVLDQLYWFIMFILSAFELFGPRLRHHLQRIAEYYFSLHSPDRLEPLHRLGQQVHNGTVTVLNSIAEDFCYYEGKHDDQLCLTYMEKPLLLQEVELIRNDRSQPVYLLNLLHWDWNRPWSRWRPFTETKLFQSLYRVVSDAMYERLQYQICQHLSGLLQQSSVGRRVRQSQFKAILDALFRHGCVQNDIDGHVFQELCRIKPEIEKMHDESVRRLREYHDDDTMTSFTDFYHVSQFNRQQNETLEYVLLLETCNQRTPILEKIRREILERLHRAAHRQIRQWLNTQREICQLRQIDFIEPLDDVGQEARSYYWSFFEFDGEVDFFYWNKLKKSSPLTASRSTNTIYSPVVDRWAWPNVPMDG